jgi:hypothetical protein
VPEDVRAVIWCAISFDAHRAAGKAHVITSEESSSSEPPQATRKNGERARLNSAGISTKGWPLSMAAAIVLFPVGRSDLAQSERCNTCDMAASASDCIPSRCIAISVIDVML